MARRKSNSAQLSLFDSPKRTYKLADRYNTPAYQTKTQVSGYNQAATTLDTARYSMAENVTSSDPS